MEKYKGTIIEASLADKSVLQQLEVTRTYPLEDWQLYDVLITEEQLDRLGQYLNDGPWYMHFWKPGADEVVVVYKDKSFRIRYSDKATWADAISHGKSRGIPEGQLDFLIH